MSSLIILYCFYKEQDEEVSGLQVFTKFSPMLAKGFPRTGQISSS